MSEVWGAECTWEDERCVLPAWWRAGREMPRRVAGRGAGPTWVASHGARGRRPAGGTAISLLTLSRWRRAHAYCRRPAGGAVIPRLLRPSRPRISPASCGRAGALIAAPCTPGSPLSVPLKTCSCEPRGPLTKRRGRIRLRLRAGTEGATAIASRDNQGFNNVSLFPYRRSFRDGIAVI